MRLLIDTDAFCKLAVADILSDALALLGANLSECGRLPALPHMLRRGRLVQAFGEEVCNGMIPLAQAMPVVTASSNTWLDSLAPVPAVDPGEAILLSVAAEDGLLLISGDARALQAVKEIEGMAEALAGRIVVLEAILLALCRRHGPDVMSRRVQPLRAFDTVVRSCFSSRNREPEEGLGSYYRSRVTELTPLVLWDPATDDEA